MKDISKRIKELRTAAGLTQDELAEKLFVTRQAVSGWENHKTRPDIETLEKLADLFGMDMMELLYGKQTIDINIDRRRLFPTILFGGLFLLGLVLPMFFSVAIQSLYYRFEMGWLVYGYTMLVRCCYGAFFPFLFSLISVFRPFCVKSLALRVILVVLGIALLLLFFSFWVFTPLYHLTSYVSQQIFIRVTYAVGMSQYTTIIAGGLLWLGLNKA